MKKPGKTSAKAAGRTAGRYIPVARPAQIRALSSGLRQEIVDLVQALSAASVPELAQQLGRPADALYYYVRALRKAGLLVEAGARRRGRHTETLYSTVDPARRLKLEYRPGNEAIARPLRALVGSMLRSARGDFDRAIADPDCVVDGPRRELWAGRIKGWLSPAELERVNAHLARLGELLSSPRSAGRDRLYALEFVLAPTQPASAAGVEPRPSHRRPTRRSPS